MFEGYCREKGEIVMQSQRANIYWFLLDGLSPWFLHSCGQSNLKENFIDELIQRGTVFTNVFTTDAGTHTSLHSIFSSLLPSYNGAVGWPRKALRKFDKNIDTFTDRLKQLGYATYRYCDADRERTVPMSGFDVWESSSYPIGVFLQKTDYGDCPRRRAFIRNVNEEMGPKFVYEHIEVLHDLNGALGRVWEKEAYLRNIEKTAEVFKKLYYEYDITDDDYVILSSDHGVLLDVDWLVDGTEHGERIYEISTVAFFSIQGPEIPPRILSLPISAMDEVPTILDLLQATPLHGQGRTQLPYMERGEYEKQLFVREKGSYCVAPELRSPYQSDVFYIRDGDWKYVYGLNDPRTEWLMDLSRNNDYEVNLLKKYPGIAKRYRQKLKKIFARDTLQQVLERCHAACTKKQQPVFFSIVIEQSKIGMSLLSDLADIAGPYYEVLVLGKEKVIDDKRIRFFPSKEKAMRAINGEWVILITRELSSVSEYFLSDVYLAIKAHNFMSYRYRVSSGIYAFLRTEWQKGLPVKILREEIRIGGYVRKSDAFCGKYYLYGAGTYAKKIIYDLGTDFLLGCIISKTEKNRRKLSTDLGLPIYQFTEYKENLRHEKAIVVIAVTPNSIAEKEITDVLEKEGISFIKYTTFRRECVEMLS